MPSAQGNLRIAKCLLRKLLSKAGDLGFPLGPNGIDPRVDRARMNTQNGKTSAARTVGRQYPKGHCRKAGAN